MSKHLKQAKQTWNVMIRQNQSFLVMDKDETAHDLNDITIMDYKESIYHFGALLTTSERQKAFQIIGDFDRAKYSCTLLL